jgi:hypothetical protein
MSRRDISAGIRARQRSTREAVEVTGGPLFEPEEEPVHYLAVPVALDQELERQLSLINRTAEEAGRAGFTKSGLIRLALRQLVEAPPEEIVSRHDR